MFGDVCPREASWVTYCLWPVTSVFYGPVGDANLQSTSSAACIVPTQYDRLWVILYLVVLLSLHPLCIIPTQYDTLWVILYLVVLLSLHPLVNFQYSYDIHNQQFETRSSTAGRLLIPGGYFTYDTNEFRPQQRHV